MLAPTKKPHTDIRIDTHDRSYRFSGIPTALLKTLLTSLKNYEDASIPWRAQAKKRMDAVGGETAYMVRTSRKAANMTQTALAARLNMPQSNLSQIETGKRTVGKALAKKLGKILNRDYRVFL